MAIPEKMAKLLRIIEGFLWFNEDRDNIVVIRKEEFDKNELSLEDIKLCLQSLVNQKIIKYWNIIDRIKNEYPTTYEEKMYCLDNQITGLLSERCLDSPLFFFLIEDRNKIIELLKEAPKEQPISRKISFDSLNGVLSCGPIQYKIQSGIKLDLMKKLWEERREIKIDPSGKEKIIRKGMMWPKRSLATNIEKNEEDINQAIKNLNLIFREKEFPAKIKIANGFQFIIKT